MSSKINNLGIIKALGESLDIIDIKQGPTQFRTDEMVATLEVSPGWASYDPFHVRMGQGGSIDLDSANGIELPLIVSDPSAYTSALGGENECLVNAGREYIIMGIRFDIDYLLTSTPDAGKQLSFRHIRRYNNSDPNTVVTCGQLNPWEFVRSGQLNYTWNFPFSTRYTTSGNPFESWQYLHTGYDRIWVPAGCDFAIGMDSATPFPADTFVTCQFWGVSCPKGLRPPLC